MRHLLPLAALFVLFAVIYLSLIVWGLMTPLAGSGPGAIAGIIFYIFITKKLRIRQWGKI